MSMAGSARRFKCLSIKMRVDGVGERKTIDGRPYHASSLLLNSCAISPALYRLIQSFLVA